MLFLPHVGLYNRVSGINKLASGVYYNTQPTEIPMGSLAVEDKCVFEFRRISGTCTVGELMYNTGTAGDNWVCHSGTAQRPVGVTMIAPTASGAWTWLQKYGKCTSIQCTTTFGVDGTNKLTAAMFALGGSAAYNLTAAISAAAIGSAGVGNWMHYIGEALSDCAAATAGEGFLRLL